MCDYFSGTITYDTINDKYRNDDADQDKDDDDGEEEDEEHSGGDDDDDDDDERNGSVIDTDSKVATKTIQSNQLENVRREATVLVDRVLEESMSIVNEQQDRDQGETHDSGVNGAVDVVRSLGLTSATVSDSNNRQEYNSESENYAITCDVVGGVDVVKSPTIESMSGKSFDDNLSSSDDQQQQHPVGPQETPSQSGDDMRGSKITVQTAQTKGKCYFCHGIEGIHFEQFTN